ncbi:ABC transporter permease [Longispora albida]|uniref:ABC transporter permease n=1 Tax=Longispora albida TaxID=203523 RepID=UPI00035E38F6|nr:ABC transporter permease [Longispora albida]
MRGGFAALATAMLRGFVRDRTALFFTILFPLMFLVVFGGIFKDPGTPRAKIAEIGQVALLDQAPPASISKVLDITKEPDRAKALEAVRKGDYAAAVEADGDRLVVHYSAADQVKAGIVQGILGSIVDEANRAGAPPKFTLSAEQVEDASLKPIQYLTPGLLAWAISMGGTFGAALTLVEWRRKKILRRIRLAPVSTFTVVSARVWISILIALAQTGIFVAVASIPFFGLRLSPTWWMTIPMVVCATLAFLSIGLVAGAFTKTGEAASAVANLIVLPMAFLSGAFFPLDNAPSWLKNVASVLPMRHAVLGIQDVMVKGLPWTSVLPEMGILLGFALVVGFLATRLFTWDDV